MKHRRLRLSALAAVLGGICIAYYILCGTLYSFTMSGLWIWPGFALILLFGCLWKAVAEPKISPRLMPVYRRLKAACLTVLALFLLIFAVFQCCLIGEWIRGYGEDVSPDAIIILGAAVEDDTAGYALSQRIDTAYALIAEHPDTPVIACGGLGEGDSVTEAECIRRELVRRGADGSMILIEDTSASTTENFRNAARLIPEDAECIAVVTSGFHQLRALMTGRTVLREAGIHNTELIPVSADHKSILLPYNMVREYAAFLSETADGNIVPG